MTHVKVPEDFTKPVGHIDLNNDGIGYVESYDFSRANMSNESRIAAISTIASVCYMSPKASGSISLYDRLANESAGLPSSSFEFVPVLLTEHQVFTIREDWMEDIHTSTVEKYGEWVEDGEYLLTNLRALMSDVGDRADEFFNTEEECAIIAEHFKVYKAKIDLATRAQFIRHRVSWQELSRRYVSGKKSAFEFYISPKLDFPAIHSWNREAVHLYSQAISDGVKPEEARRILPQAMYTTLWSAWQPKQLDVFYKLRLDSHAQSEIRELAEGMRKLS